MARAHRSKLPRLHVVVESGHRNVGDAIRIFNEIKKHFAGSDADMLETISIADKDESTPLMMADFVAHVSFMLEMGVRDGTRKPRETEAMAISLEADFEPAMQELRALILDDVNLAEALDHVAKAGLPFLVLKVDELATNATGNLAFSYKLSDHLKVSLATVRARNERA